MNNVVSMFSPTDEKTPYEQEEYRNVSVKSGNRSGIWLF